MHRGGLYPTIRVFEGENTENTFRARPCCHCDWELITTVIPNIISNSGQFNSIIYLFVCLVSNPYRLCGLVVRVPGYRCRDPGSISGATGFF
jgi:hypothetical protein